MSTGKGIAIPPTKKPIQAVGKFSLTLDGDPGGLSLSVRGASKEVIRHAIATGGYVMGTGAIADPEPEPQPEPATRATRKPISAATKAKMAAAQKKRQAELRKAQEGVSETTSSTPKATKRKLKTMTAGSAA